MLYFVIKSQHSNASMPLSTILSSDSWKGTFSEVKPGRVFFLVILIMGHHFCHTLTVKIQAHTISHSLFRDGLCEPPTLPQSGDSRRVVAEPRPAWLQVLCPFHRFRPSFLASPNPPNTAHPLFLNMLNVWGKASLLVRVPRRNNQQDMCICVIYTCVYVYFWKDLFWGIGSCDGGGLVSLPGAGAAASPGPWEELRQSSFVLRGCQPCSSQAFSWSDESHHIREDDVLPSKSADLNVNLM